MYFLDAGLIFLFYILLIWGVRTHPTHPPAYGPAVINLHRETMNVLSLFKTFLIFHVRVTFYNVFLIFFLDVFTPMS